jgi:hypothetical protein
MGLPLAFDCREWRSDADSGEGYRRRSYAIKKAEELSPNAELVIDES